MQLGPKIEAWRLQPSSLMRLVIFSPNLALKSMPGGLKPSNIEAQGLQNRAWSPPRRHFLRTLNLRRFKRSYPTRFWGQKSQLGSILEAQDPPKSKPKPEKIDVEKQHVFGIDFLRIWTRFREAQNLKNSNFA